MTDRDKKLDSLDIMEYASRVYMSQDGTSVRLSQAPVKILFDPEGVSKKVESIFALQKAAMERKPMKQRRDVDIQMVEIPYRHESTYAVSLDELLDILENLIGTLANPKIRKKRLNFEPAEAPDFKKYFNSLENIIGKYQDLVLSKVRINGHAFLNEITSSLDSIDSIRCFFAILFLARDQKVDLEQINDDIKVSLLEESNGVENGEG